MENFHKSSQNQNFKLELKKKNKEMYDGKMAVC